MSAAAQLALILVGAGLLLLVEFALSVALVAVTALTRVAMRRLSSESDGRLEFLEEMKQPSSSHLSAAIILRQLSLVGAVALLVIAARLAGWAVPEIVGAAATVVLGVLVSEALLARAAAMWNPRRALRVTLPLVRLAHVLLFPIVKPLQVVLAWVRNAKPTNGDERDEDQEEEAEALIEVGEREGILEAREGEMMRGIVDLDETRVREIMTPRTEIEALPVDWTIAQARTKLLEGGHSRLPIYRGSIDNVVGVLHARDLFRAWQAGSDEERIARYLRPATFVPETLSAGELLSEMRQKTHLAVVVDEYGGTAGLVTLEDLLEEIVGDIREEHEIEEELIEAQDDGSWIVSAVCHVNELEDLFGVEFEEREFDTVGGLVIFGFGRVPSSGETLETHGLHIDVLQADRRRVHRVRVRPASPGEAQGASPA